MQEEEQKLAKNEPADTKEEKKPEDNPNSVQGSRDFTRRSLLHVLCSGYLLYLSYKLIRGFLDEYPVKGWTGTTIMCLAGAAVFIGVSAVLLTGCVRRLIQRARDERENQTTERNKNDG